MVAIFLSFWRVQLENLAFDDDYNMLLSGSFQEIMNRFTTGGEGSPAPGNQLKELEDHENVLNRRLSRKVRLGIWLNIFAIFFFCLGYLAIVILMWVGACSL
jgi:hypothetical protein